MTLTIPQLLVNILGCLVLAVAAIVVLVLLVAILWELCVERQVKRWPDKTRALKAMHWWVRRQGGSEYGTYEKCQEHLKTWQERAYKDERILEQLGHDVDVHGNFTPSPLGLYLPPMVRVYPDGAIEEIRPGQAAAEKYIEIGGVMQEDPRPIVQRRAEWGEKTTRWRSLR